MLSSEPNGYAAGGIFLSIVVPVWNGAERLPAALAELVDFIESRPYPTELVIADDGSGPATVDTLENFAARHARVVVLRHLPHRGKGFSVAAGMGAARGRYRVFIDSDLAYPAAEIEKVVRALEAGSDVATACRVLPESRYVMSPGFFHYLYTRHVMSRVFNVLVRLLLLPDLLDTQAGLKGFTSSAADLIFPRLTIPGFGFDLECLFIARTNGLRITQVPIVFRYDDEPTSIRFLRDAVQMLVDITMVRLRSWSGQYTATSAELTNQASLAPAADTSLES